MAIRTCEGTKVAAAIAAGGVGASVAVVDERAGIIDSFYLWIEGALVF